MLRIESNYFGMKLKIIFFGVILFFLTDIEMNCVRDERFLYLQNRCAQSSKNSETLKQL